MLDQLSAISAQSFCCEPSSPEASASGDEHRQAQQRLCSSFSAEESGIWSFDHLPGLLDDLFPPSLVPPPKLLRFSRAIYSRQVGRALFNSRTGFVHPGTMLTRLPRHQHVPELKNFHIDLIQTLQYLPYLREAVFLPSANCCDLESWLGETNAYLWPFLPHHAKGIQGLPVIVCGCASDQPFASHLFRTIRGAHCFPIFECDLPEVFWIKNAFVPTPAYRFLAGFRKLHFRSCSSSFAIGESFVPKTPLKICVEPDPRLVKPKFRDLYKSLANMLGECGWKVISQREVASAKSIVALKGATEIVMASGPDIRMLSVLGPSIEHLRLCVVCDELRVDDALQLRAQNVRGVAIDVNHRDDGLSRDEVIDSINQWMSGSF